MSAYTDRLRQIAIEEGVDPDVALRVIQGEGGFTNPVQRSLGINPNTGRQEHSYGPLQLNMEGGVGALALQHGIDPRREDQWEDAYRFGLRHAKRRGWGEWSHARKIGLDLRAGLGGAGGATGKQYDLETPQPTGNQAILDKALAARSTGPNTRRPGGPEEAAGGGSLPDTPNRFARSPYGPLEAAGGGSRPDRFSRRPYGPLEAAGGGSEPDRYSATAPSSAYGPYGDGGDADVAAAAVAADDREEERKAWWKKHFDPSGGADTLAGIGGEVSPVAAKSAYPGAARVDAPDVSQYYAQMSQMQRQALAEAMARLNSGRLF